MGLARIESQTGDYDVTVDRGLTQSGEVLGTVDYMSPEQATSTKDVDERSDIYSLGCTLFFLLTGRPVYEGDTLVKKILAHRDHPIPSLSKIRHDVPKQLDVAFRRMLNKKAEFRIRSMTEVIAQLENIRVDGTGGGVKPKQAPTAASRTRTAGNTVRAAGTPPAPTTALSSATNQTTSSPASAANPTKTSAPPPPPDITPRDRTPVARNRPTDREKSIERVKKLEKKKEDATVWRNSIDDALKREASKTRWEMIRRKVGDGFATTTKWLLLLILAIGIPSGGYLIYQNAQRLVQSQDRVLTAVNEQLGNRSFDSISNIEFSDTTFGWSVPESLAFERPLYTANAPGKRQGATLKGQFDRVEGLIKIVEPFQIELRVDPVP
jgi:serine/threonine protein kinase